MLKYTIEIIFKDDQQKEFYVFSKLMEKHPNGVVDGLYLIEGMECPEYDDDYVDYEEEYDAIVAADKINQHNENIIDDKFKFLSLK